MRKILCIVKSVLWGTLIVVFLCGCGKDTAHFVETEQKCELDSLDTEHCSTEKQESTEMIEANIYVYVCGQIQKPGVYTLPEGSRVCDVFELAGGFTKDAATDYWNQARLLTDGEMLYVPTIEEAEGRYFEGDTIRQENTDDSNKVNINTASKEELMTLPGIGEAKALAIINYRQEHGAFSSLDELKEVEGIKEGVFSKMKHILKFN